MISMIRIFALPITLLIVLPIMLFIVLPIIKKKKRDKKNLDLFTDDNKTEGK